jgi:hypothetical protein
MATPTRMWIKLARRLGRDSNPLRRRSDRIEPWLVPGAVAVFLALSPLVVGVAAIWVHTDNSAAHRAEQSWKPVHAELLAAAPGPEMSDNGGNAWLVWTPARWTFDGRKRTGDVPAAAGSRAGSTVTILVDRSGAVHVPPLTAAEARNLILTAASVTLAVLALLFAGLVMFMRHALDSQRLKDWETAWQAVGPRWSHQD